jgi:hypothetical protein
MLPLLFLLLAQAPDLDTDHDGLSDFQEVHKYFTDPKKADSDGDGIPDGDWEERREYAYTVRTVVHVLPPVTDDVLADDYQDARVLERTPEYVEIEVIHYPLNTVAEAIAADPRWREHTRGVAEYVRPGLTANWDEAMRKDLVAALAKDGIEALELDDKTLVERASKWLLERTKSVDGFTTFCSWFPGGKVAVFPGLEAAAERGKAGTKLSIEEQWQRELFAKGMFESGVRGTCTSSAIYMNGCLRALGIPTRIVLCIPLVDSSDEREIGFLSDRLTLPGVRRIVRRAIPPSQSWTSHTFNEVFVGGRWRRLNYDRLGQNVLDPQFLGLMTHVATFNDWADGEMAKTWGTRQKQEGPRKDVFGGSNPYSTIALSDRVGAHAKIAKEWLEDAGQLSRLTIEKLYWWDSPERTVEMRLDDPDTAGHLLVHVREGRAGEGSGQYKDFYDGVDKGFRLEAEGRPGIAVRATRGYWATPEKGIQEFYLRIEPAELAKMAVGVPYRLVALNGNPECQWVVADGVTIVRQAGSVAPAAPGETLALDQVRWSDDPSVPKGIRPEKGAKPVLLAHVAGGKRFEALKSFTEKADLRFFLESEGHATLKVGAAVGGVTLGPAVYAVITLGPADWRDLVQGIEYRLVPENSKAGPRWAVEEGLRVVRR